MEKSRKFGRLHFGELSITVTPIFGKKVTHSEKLVLVLVVKLSRFKLLFSTKKISSLPSLPIFWRCVVSVSVVKCLV